jgi:uncharacterized protein YjbJ (UPF0337 family)
VNVSHFEQIIARSSFIRALRPKEAELHHSHRSGSGALQVLEAEIVDKDRIVGSAKEIKGAVKEIVGKTIGDAKLESDGKTDKIEGKVQNAIGGLKDTLKGK